MLKHTLLILTAAFSLIAVTVSVPVRQAQAQTDVTLPTVFQAAGPTIGSIQGTVDQFRAALGAQNNGNTTGPLEGGRREINWDGGGSTATAIAETPFTGFLNSRGALFTTPGTGFVQAPLGGIAETFENPSYETAFQAFSPVRLFSPIGSNVTEVEFFVPGGGDIPATVNGFGAIFSDVDKPTGGVPDNKNGNRVSSTLLKFFDANGRLLFSSFVPSSPGNGNLSFFGIVFNDARIARVKIRTGDAIPGADDGNRDIVMMDDFIYGEPQPLP